MSDVVDKRSRAEKIASQAYNLRRAVEYSDGQYIPGHIGDIGWHRLYLALHESLEYENGRETVDPVLLENVMQVAQRHAADLLWCPEGERAKDWWMGVYKCASTNGFDTGECDGRDCEEVSWQHRVMEANKQNASEQNTDKEWL